VWVSELVIGVTVVITYGRDTRCVLRKYSSAGQDKELHWLSSENGTGPLPAASHYRGSKAQGRFSDSRQTRSSSRDRWWSHVSENGRIGRWPALSGGCEEVIVV